MDSVFRHAPYLILKAFTYIHPHVLPHPFIPFPPAPNPFPLDQSLKLLLSHILPSLPPLLISAAHHRCFCIVNMLLAPSSPPAAPATPPSPKPHPLSFGFPRRRHLISPHFILAHLDADRSVVECGMRHPTRRRTDGLVPVDCGSGSHGCTACKYAVCRMGTLMELV